MEGTEFINVCATCVSFAIWLITTFGTVFLLVGEELLFGAAGQNGVVRPNNRIFGFFKQPITSA